MFENINWDKTGFYNWMQRELETQLKKRYKIHRVAVFGDMFCIWFLNNEDSISIPLAVMREFYNDGKSFNKLATLIEMEYVNRIKKD